MVVTGGGVAGVVGHPLGLARKTSVGGSSLGDCSAGGGVAGAVGRHPLAEAGLAGPLGVGGREAFSPMALLFGAGSSGRARGDRGSGPRTSGCRRTSSNVVSNGFSMRFILSRSKSGCCRTSNGFSVRFSLSGSKSSRLQQLAGEQCKRQSIVIAISNNSNCNNDSSNNSNNNDNNSDNNSYNNNNDDNNCSNNGKNNSQ